MNAKLCWTFLLKYERASSQQINRAKTTLFFSKPTNADIQDRIKDMLGVMVVQQYEKYLGLPSLVGRNKTESFSHIKQQIWKKLQGWESKLLSQAGREILIKVVAQALPTYTMSCFKLPLTLCNEIEALIRKFFWVKEVIIERFIGWNGRIYVSLNHKKV